MVMPVDRSDKYDTNYDKWLYDNMIFVLIKIMAIRIWALFMFLFTNIIYDGNKYYIKQIIADWNIFRGFC